MYESPINLIEIERQIIEDQEKGIFKVIKRMGIDVDRDELIKALQYDRDQYAKGYRDGKAEAAEWIPASERLPEAGEYIGNVAKYYLVQNEYGDMMVARYTHSEYWEQIYQLEPVGDKIVAWMPLPKPYKAESEDGYRFYHSTRGGRI